jgi:hypothetical protein
MDVGNPEAIGATGERSHYFWFARDSGAIQRGVVMRLPALGMWMLIALKEH